MTDTLESENTRPTRRVSKQSRRGAKKVPSAAKEILARREALQLRFVVETKQSADGEFLDDLLAAKRFKSFLVSQGVEINADVLHGIAELLYVFSKDLDQYEKGVGLPPSLPGDRG